MSEDSFSESEDEPGFFSKLMSSIAGIFVGLLMIAAMVPFLWWNEGRAVGTAEALTEGAGAAVHAEATAADPGNEGKLVHINGKAETAAKLKDEAFGVEVADLGLERKVEMFQWKQNSETKKVKSGGKEKKVTTYTYEQTWSSSVIDSSKFKKEGYSNPGSMPFTGEKWWAKPITVGGFELSDNLSQQISAWGDLSLEADALDKVSEANKTGLVVSGGGFYKVANFVPVPAVEGVPPVLPVVPAEANLGDTRVTFRVNKSSDVSLLGKQTGKNLGSFKSSRDYELSDLRMGTMTKDQMFEAAQSENTIMTWILRIGGFMVMWMGMFSLGKPFIVIADVLPFAGSIATFAVGLLAFGGAAVCSLGTMALAWIFYRPLLAIGLICVGVMIMGGMVAVIAVLAKMFAGGGKADPEPA